MNKLSIIIPTLNEAEDIRAFLKPLQYLRQQGHQIIVVDGGSEDNTFECVLELVDCAIRSAKGRAQQMNAGAKIATNDRLLFLHADTLLPSNVANSIPNATPNQWGHFDLTISGRHWLLPIIAKLINIRSRITGIATGDQAIFINSEFFEHAGGFPEIPLMEDVALCKQLRKIQRPVCLQEKVITSGRRWEKHGVFCTVLLMWVLRFAYFIGIKPEKLANLYATH